MLLHLMLSLRPTPEVPEVTRKRIYLETMEQVLQNAGRKIILDDEVSGVLPLLNLNQEGK